MTKEIIANKVKEKKGKTSYYRVSKLTGLTPVQIKGIENGKAYTIDSLLIICKALNIKLTIK